MMSEAEPKTIVIFGSSRPKPGSARYLQAYELGKMLGAAGYVVANGGYGGVMEASARGAREAGGKTIGVTCGAFGRGGANQWIDKEIRTASLNERLEELIGLGDGYVVLPGSTGTLLEIAMVWELINKQFVSERPIIFMSDYWKPVIDTVMQAGEAEGGSIRFLESLELVGEELRGRKKA